MNKLTLAAISLALCSSSVGAAIISTQSATFSGFNLSAADTTTFGNTSVVSSADIAMSFNRFNADTGVLTGVSSTLTLDGGVLNFTTSGTKSAGTARVVNVSGNASARSNLFGLSGNGFFGTYINESFNNGCTNNAACFPSGATNLLANPNLQRVDNTWFSGGTLAVSAPNLNDKLNAYVGTTPLVSALTVKNTVSLGNAIGVVTPKAELAITGLAGNQSLNYTYLKHANASFSSNSDTDELTQELYDGPFIFSIFNFGDANTTSMDSLSFLCISGDCDDFALSLSLIQNLGVGNSFDGFVEALYGEVVGDYEATYAFLFSDDTAIGATSTHQNNTLLLTVHGTVAAIPEPGTIGLLLPGLVALIIGSRRRRQQFVI